MRELGIRAITGAIYVALTLGAAWSGPFTTLLLFLPVCVIAMREMHLLYWGEDAGPPVQWSMLLGATIHVSLAMGLFEPSWNMGYTVAIGFLLLLISTTLMLLRGDPDPTTSFGGLLTLILLVATPFGLLVHFFRFGTWSFIGFMLLLWTNDTGAYLTGRLIGRTKLLPSVSPKKTVEGLIGGIALTLVVAWLLAQYQTFLTTGEWLTAGAIIALTSTLGDLLESAFKRARGVKDSGTILPGHGGILDRFDGFFLAVPSLLLYLHLVH
ncbi:MAG TPA: phosphatidate cytidylyltransferase [Flavobacteriales bacterium]|nr:phosphatidate cytidylyltransferase [Flavobacteriales bacterium]